MVSWIPMLLNQASLIVDDVLVVHQQQIDEVAVLQQQIMLLIKAQAVNMSGSNRRAKRGIC